MVTTPRLLNTRTAAAYCGVTTGVLRKHGPLPIRLGNKNYFDTKVLDHWVDSLSKQGELFAEDQALRALDDG